MNQVKKMLVNNPLQKIWTNVTARQGADALANARSKPMRKVGWGHIGLQTVVKFQQGGFVKVDGSDPNVDFNKAIDEVAEFHDKAADKRARALDGYDRQVIARDSEINDVTGTEPVENKYGFISESLPENTNVKRNVLKPIADSSPDAFVGIDTSSLPIGEIANGFVNPERVVGIHSFDPVFKSDLVEVVRAPQTSDEAMAFALNLVRAQGKTAVICDKDTVGAAANEIITGLINEAGKIVAEGRASTKVVDEVFLEVFFGDQHKLLLPKWIEGSKKIPKLDFFNDEVAAYKEIRRIDKRLQRILSSRNTLKYIDKVKELIQRKKELIEGLVDKLNQKALYKHIGAEIGHREHGAGTFFAPPEGSDTVQKMAIAQRDAVKAYLATITKDEDYLTPFEITPYKTPDFKRSWWQLGMGSPKPIGFEGNTTPIPVAEFNDRKYIADRLRGAYIAIAYQLYLDGKSTMHDIEIMCKAGFKYNIGPFELAKRIKEEYGEEEVERLIALANEGLPNDKPTGIAKPQYIEPGLDELSGIQTYVRNGKAHIVMGRYHMQNMQMMMNSLHPDMINAMIRAIDKYNADGNVNAIIIESQGSNDGKAVFCSGADLTYAQKHRKDQKVLAEYTELGRTLMRRIKNSEKPVTAIVTGSSAGGGVELLAACDYRFGFRGLTGATPEVSLGLIPAWEGTDNLAELMGKEAALAFICNLKSLFPGGWNWLDVDTAMKLGMMDNQKPVSIKDLPIFMADLEEGKVIGKINGQETQIDITQKPDRIPQSNKPLQNPDGTQNYPANIVYKWRMKEDREGNVEHKPPKYRGFAAKLAAIMVMYSDNPELRDEKLAELVRGGRIKRGVRWAKSWIWDQPTVQEDIGSKLAKGFSRTYNWKIRPYTVYAQNKVVNKGVNGAVAGLKAAKVVAKKSASVGWWLTKQGLFWGVGIPARIAYDYLWHKPAYYEMPKDYEQPQPEEVTQAGENHGS